MTVKIKGVIGWDVVGTQLADLISRLDGDINFEIDSPGGSLSDGISIFNAIHAYNKGKKNVCVVGQASSMAAYIMLAGDTLTFKSNATVVLHNPFNSCCGDYNAMKKNAELLERFSALYAKKFVEKGIFTEKEIRSIMDETTYFIGETDLKRLGAVEGSTAEDETSEETRETAIIVANEHIKACQARMRESEVEDFEKVAALIPPLATTEKTSSVDVKEKENKTKVTVQKEGEKIMDLNELKTTAPGVYAEATKDGAEQEKKRVSALMEFIDIDKDTVIKAIAEGKTIHDDDVYASILKAKVSSTTLANMEGDNPPAANPGEPPHAPENEEDDAAKKIKENEATEAKQLDDVVAFLGYKE